MRPVLPGLLLSGLAASVLAASPRAESTELRAGNQLEVYYDTQVDESVVDDRLDVDLRYDRFSAGIVFLSHSASNYLKLDQNKFGPSKQGIRKRWVTASNGPFEVRAGDSYATFGSGLVLRIFEDQAVDFDNVIDGARAQVTHGALTFEGIAGTNSYGEARTVVKGLSGRVEPRPGWLFGLNGAVIDTVSGDAPQPGRDGVASVQVDGGLPGGIDLTGEYAVRRYTPERPGRATPADGHATYLAAHGGIGPFSFSAEAKDLLRFKHAYTTPPTVARQHASTLLNRGSHVPNIRLDDERGVQTEILWTPYSNLLLTGNWSRSEARHATLPARETFGQAELDWKGAHLVAYGAETEEKVRERADRVFFERITYGGDALRGLGRDWSLELGLETQGVQEQDLAKAFYQFPLQYRESLASITLAKAPRHSWAATVEWTDNPNDASGSRGGKEKDSWAWFEWTIRLGVAGQISLGAGSLRGGQVCSGGVCKQVDPFEGGRIELLTNF